MAEQSGMCKEHWKLIRELGCVTCFQISSVSHASKKKERKTQINREKDIEKLISVSGKMKPYNGRLISAQSVLRDDTNTHCKRCKRHRAPKTECDYELNGLFNLMKLQFLNRNCALNI